MSTRAASTQQQPLLGSVTLDKLLVTESSHEGAPSKLPTAQRLAYPEQSDSEVDDRNRNASVSSGADGAAGKSSDTEASSTPTLHPFSFLSVVYFLTCGGAYGLEPLGGTIPPLYTLLFMALAPIFWGLPMSLLTCELSLCFPEEVAHGYIAWVRMGWGDFVCFVDGWTTIFVDTVDLPLYAFILIGYMDNLVALEGTVWYYVALCGFVVVCTGIALCGVSSLGRSSDVFTFITILPFVVFVIAAFASSSVNPSVWSQTEAPGENLSDLAVFLSLFLWASAGYEYSGFYAQYLEDPKTTVPRMMGIACLLTMLSYVLPIGIAMSVVPTTDGSLQQLTDLQPGSFTAIADSFGYGAWIGDMILIGGVFANAASFNAFLYTASQALFTMSQEGKAPACFSYSKRWTPTPFITILFIAVITIGLLFLNFDLVVQLQGILYSLHIIVVVTALLRLRKKFPERERPFRIPTPWPFAHRFPDLGAYLVALLPLSVVGFTLYYSDPTYVGCCLGALTVVAAIYWIREWCCPRSLSFHRLHDSSRGSVSYSSTTAGDSQGNSEDETETGSDTSPTSDENERVGLVRDTPVPNEHASSRTRSGARLPPVFPLSSAQVRNLYMHVPIPELAAAQNILDRRQKRSRRRRRRRRRQQRADAEAQIAASSHTPASSPEHKQPTSTIADNFRPP